MLKKKTVANKWFKGIVHPEKLQFYYWLLTLMSFQTWKDFFHLPNINSDISFLFLMKSESSLTLPRQQVSHVQGPIRYQEHRQNSPCEISGSTVILWSYRILSCPKKILFNNSSPLSCFLPFQMCYRFGTTWGWAITEFLVELSL